MNSFHFFTTNLFLALMDFPTRSTTPNRALAWALLSQSIWLPLLAIDVHDRWQAQMRVQREIAEASMRRSPQGETPRIKRSGAVATTTGKLKDTGLLLGSASRSPLNPSDRTGVVSEAGLAGFAPTGPSHPLHAARTGNPPLLQPLLLGLVIQNCAEEAPPWASPPRRPGLIPCSRLSIGLNCSEAASA